MPFCTICHTKLNCICGSSNEKNYKLKGCYNKFDCFPHSFIGDANNKQCILHICSKHCKSVYKKDDSMLFIRLVTWNINSSSKPVDYLLDEFINDTVDVLFLQETTLQIIDYIKTKLLVFLNYSLIDTKTKSHCGYLCILYNNCKFKILEVKSYSASISIKIQSKWCSDEVLELVNCHLPPFAENGQKRINIVSNLYKNKQCDTFILAGDLNMRDKDWFNLTDKLDLIDVFEQYSKTNQVLKDTWFEYYYGEDNCAKMRFDRILISPNINIVNYKTIGIDSEQNMLSDHIALSVLLCINNKINVKCVKCKDNGHYKFNCPQNKKCLL